MRSSGVRWLVTLASAGLLACGGDDDGAGGRPGELDRDDAGATDAATDATSSEQSDGAQSESDAESHAESDAGDKSSCAAVSAAVELEPVYLAFAFDVSASMGSGHSPWFDKTLKWTPVVNATRAFFQSQSAAGLFASLTFFPNEKAPKNTYPNPNPSPLPQFCKAAEYVDPDVAMTALPSTAFGTSIDAIPTAKQADWRLGTPTLAVVSGQRTFVRNFRQQNEGRYALVLVTDGYPEYCGNGVDSVDVVVAEAKRALDENLPTYVIGVANPKIDGAPDTVSDLHRIAKAGGTDKAFLIDTNDANATATAFSAAVAQIQKSSVSCSVAIPSSGDFDKRNVAVHYLAQGQSYPLSYDKTCAAARSWHYDNVDDPKQIVLCDATCDEVRAAREAAIEVEFACEQQVFYL